MSDTSSQNQQLKQQFRELIAKAMNNQSILERFQQFELAMLSAENITDLIETLLFTSIRHFTLSDCRLVWFDREQELRLSLSDSTRQQCGHRLVFNSMMAEIDDIFSQHYKPVLTPLGEQEKPLWFPGKTVVQSAAFIPLLCSGALAGCIILGSSEPTRFTSDKAVDFMAHMGLIAAMCLQNSANKECIRRLSMIDNLTQVKNRRCFDSDINKEVARAQRAGQPLSCLFIDADFFKAINDNYGHQAGDAVLCALANWVRLQLRECDHLARYGGEEFAILLPDCDAGLAFQVAERIRTFVEKQQLEFENISLCLTLSIGVSTFEGNLYKEAMREQVVKALLGQADAAVYDAKQTGRNRVCVREFGLQGESLYVQ